MGLVDKEKQSIIVHSVTIEQLMYISLSRVSLPLGPPVIVISPESASVNMSQNALLRCQAVADPPNMTYVWLKDGENVYHVE